MDRPSGLRRTLVTTAVRVEGLGLAYRRRTAFGWRSGGTKWALRDVDLEVDAGETLAVIGGNGSGKTTLLQVLAGVLDPTAGSVTVRGRVASLVDLSAGFHRDLTGRENLRIGGILLGMSRADLDARFGDIIRFSGLADADLDAPLGGYSAGMGLRLGFSLVVHSSPDVLLVDEVLAVGDHEFQQRCIERLDDLRRGGCAVVVVTHDMAVVVDHADRAAVLADGVLVFDGAPDEAVRRHRRRTGTAPGAADLDEGPDDDAHLFPVSERTDAARRRRGAG